MLDFSLNPYQLSKEEKFNFLNTHLTHLENHHEIKCKSYKNILSTLYKDRELEKNLNHIPFLPVQIFKNIQLKSVDDIDVFKVLTSSGTTGQAVSKIYLDRETAALQSKALVSIVSHFIGKERLPMLIVDHPGIIKNRTSFSARGAGILGFSSFGRDHTYALNDSMEINFQAMEEFFQKHQEKKVLIFGFTFMIWQYLYEACIKANFKLDLSRAILIHGGGWKKLADKNISNEHFKLALREQFNLHSVHNYYGMVEQVGSIFMECSSGYLHTPDFADVIIRDPVTFKPLAQHQPGLIQVLSTLPKSYPGHSLLTEDLGTWLGEDDCDCGLKGNYFSVQGRLPKAELRGCSDTFQKEALS